PLRNLSCVDANDRVEQTERLLSGPLKGVAADDRAEATAVADAANVVEERFVALDGAAGEDHDPPPGESALDNVPDAVRHGLGLNPLLFVHLASGFLFEVRRRQLHLDDV